MRQYNLSNWPKVIKPLNGMLLFAQLWDEMLFDFALDSYKPYRFNTLGLCSELIYAYENYELGILNINSITPIIEELKDSISKDKILKKILGTKLHNLSGEFKQWNPHKPQKRVAFAASAIIKTTDSLLQVNLIKKLMELVSDPKQKAEVIDISERLLTELLRKGYSPNFIYHSVQNFFFRERQIKNLNDLQIFLNDFDSIDKDYEVIFKVPSENELIARVAEDTFLKLEKKIDPKYKLKRFERSFFDKKEDEIFIVAPDIKAKDRYSARREAENRISLISTITVFLNHKIQIDLSKEVFVYEGNPPVRSYIVNSPVKPTMKRPDIPIENFDGSIYELIQPIISNVTDKKTSERLGNALRTHAVGIDAKVTENQFANLWTSIETITRISPGRNTIDTVIKRVLPILSLKYFLKLTHELRDDIRRCIPCVYEKIVKKYKQDESEMDFFIWLINTDESFSLRSELYSVCDKNPLLRYRISDFHDKLLKSSQIALMLLKQNEQRVSWHLKRLYRARNTLIHAGFSHELIDLLVENAHDYFDHIFKEIVKRLTDEYHHGTFEKVFFEYSMDYQGYIKALEMPPDQGNCLKTAKL